MANCKLVAAPLLNEEVKVTVSESVLKRDERLATVQSQVGACLSALGKALNLLLQDEEKEDSKHLQLIELLNNTARMLADVHYQESESRKNILSVNLKRDLLAILTDSNADGWLFGENLGERVKAARAIERSGQELKKANKPVKQKPSQYQRRNLNMRGPSRAQSSSSHLGGPHYRGNSKTPRHSQSQTQNRREVRGHPQKRRGDRL
nr:unnamed protein product [Callosobruchus analis]